MKIQTKSDENGAAPPKLRRRGGMFSPITRRILAINMIALVFLGVGILYLDRYKKNLIDAELSGLLTQAEMFAAALGEGAVAQTSPGRYRVSKISNQIVGRLVQTTGIRARLFDVDGTLVADSRRLLGSGRIVLIEKLSPPNDLTNLLSQTLEYFERLILRALT